MQIPVDQWISARWSWTRQGRKDVYASGADKLRISESGSPFYVAELLLIRVSFFSNMPALKFVRSVWIGFSIL